ncbi:hypothetical protein Droror1_Dr00012357 [Drosera rotundifolia]
MTEATGSVNERKPRGFRVDVAEKTVAKSRSADAMNRVGLGFRVCEFVICLISFSVMAGDETRGWSGDSFGRHREYRFCLSVNIIAFVYSGFQAFGLAYSLATGKHVVTHHLRRQFDFVMDQAVAYLLVSASSAAATTVVDWNQNWGKDKFTDKATASVTMSFLTFLAFAISSLISGYGICSNEFS